MGSAGIDQHPGWPAINADAKQEDAVRLPASPIL